MASQSGPFLAHGALAWGFVGELVCHGAVLAARWLAMVPR